MKKKAVCMLLGVLLTGTLLTGCGKNKATEAATEAPTAPAAPVVTKDPTGEKLAPGGKTWFVAHAEGATILTWEFVSPEGMVYSVTEAMAQNPGLLLDISKTVSTSSSPMTLVSSPHSERHRSIR